MERDPYIFYRESKIYRLLQDSLGGQDEDIHHSYSVPSYHQLGGDYRASNIINISEVNQMLSKREVLKGRCDEIYKLRSELLVGRRVFSCQ